MSISPAMPSIWLYVCGCLGFLVSRIASDTPYSSDSDAWRMGFGDLGLGSVNVGAGGIGGGAARVHNAGRVDIRPMGVNGLIRGNPGFIGGTFNGDMSRDGTSFVNNLGRTAGVDSWTGNGGLGGMSMHNGLDGNLGMGGDGMLDNGMAGFGGAINNVGVPLGSGEAGRDDGSWFQGNNGAMFGDNGLGGSQVIRGGPMIGGGPDGSQWDDRSAIFGPVGDQMEPEFGMGGVVGVKAGVSRHTHTTRVVRPVVKQMVRPIVRPVINRVVRPIIQRPIIRRVVRPIIRQVIRRVVRPIIRPVHRPVYRPIIRKVFRPIIKNVIRRPVFSGGIGGMVQRPQMPIYRRKLKTYW